MAISPKCGAEMPEGTVICTVCGAPMESAQADAEQATVVEETAQANENVEAVQQTNEGAGATQQTAGQPTMNQAAIPDMPMKWFKFVIYFQLIVGPIINIISGLMTMTGSIYDMQNSSSDFVYSVFPSLSTLDKIYGVVLIIVSIIGFVARQKLAKFCTDGPKWYFTFLGTSLGAIIFYTVGSLSIYGQYLSGSEVNGQTYGQIIGFVLLIVLNIVYFNKRKHLFVN